MADPKDQVTWGGVLRQIFDRPIFTGQSPEWERQKHQTYLKRVGLENPKQEDVIWSVWNPYMEAYPSGGIASMGLFQPRVIQPGEQVDQIGRPLTPEQIEWRRQAQIDSGLPKYDPAYDEGQSLREDFVDDGQFLAGQSIVEGGTSVPMPEGEEYGNYMTMADDNQGQYMAGQSLREGGYSAPVSPEDLPVSNPAPTGDSFFSDERNQHRLNSLKRLGAGLMAAGPNPQMAEYGRQLARRQDEFANQQLALAQRQEQFEESLDIRKKQLEETRRKNIFDARYRQQQIMVEMQKIAMEAGLDEAARNEAFGAESGAQLQRLMSKARMPDAKMREFAARKQEMATEALDVKIASIVSILESGSGFATQKAQSMWEAKTDEERARDTASIRRALAELARNVNFMDANNNVTLGRQLRKMDEVVNQYITGMGTIDDMLTASILSQGGR